MIASYEEHIDNVILINLNDITNYGYDTLKFASYGNNINIIKYLINII
jgi:hypothetical protein